MVTNTSKSLPSREVHRRLLGALTDLERVQRNAVLWFAEAVRRKIYRDFGYSSIYQYAELELGFKKAKTAQFLRLCESFKELPELRRSVLSGVLSWTKAREVAKVATQDTERRWIAEAKASPRRVLENRVAATRRQARVAASGRAQVILKIGCGEKSGSSGSEDRKSGRVGADDDGGRLDSDASTIDAATPVDVHVRMTAGQYARYQALMEALAKGGAVDDKAEQILAGLEQLTLVAAGRTEKFTRVNSARAVDREEPRSNWINSKSPYQVVVQMCPRCERGSAPTSRGEKILAPGELKAILCDAHIRRAGERNKAAIPEKLRRAVLERDRYRCRSAGCGRTSFLAVHHLAPREAGGGNTLENLITLCAGCHRALHQHV